MDVMDRTAYNVRGSREDRQQFLTELTRFSAASKQHEIQAYVAALLMVAASFAAIFAWQAHMHGLLWGAGVAVATLFGMQAGASWYQAKQYFATLSRELCWYVEEMGETEFQQQYLGCQS